MLQLWKRFYKLLTVQFWTIMIVWPQSSLIGPLMIVWPQSSLIGPLMIVWPQSSLIGPLMIVWPQCSLIGPLMIVWPQSSLIGPLKSEAVAPRLTNQVTVISTAHYSRLTCELRNRWSSDRVQEKTCCTLLKMKKIYIYLLASVALCRTLK